MSERRRGGVGKAHEREAGHNHNESEQKLLALSTCFQLTAYVSNPRKSRVPSRPLN